MIRIEDLSFSYNREPLFQHMDMRLDPGNIYGLLGLNGAGKSTLLKLMTGLLFATTGELKTLGYDPARRDPSFLAKVFLLPEELNLPAITDREFEVALAPFYPYFDGARFERALREFEVPRNRRLTKLSYGQKKKFLLSFGLASGAELLVLDEPTNGLDIPSKGLFRRLVAEALTGGQIFVISTHQVRDVESLIDRIVILHAGKVLFNQSMATVTSTLRMAHSPTRPDPDSAGLLYSEPGVGGYWTVWRDNAASGGHLDLEVLFNTVIARPEVYATLFGNTAEAA